jgi:hypothetical protein
VSRPDRSHFSRRTLTVRAAAIVLFASLPARAVAGGVSYEVHIVEFARGTGTKATFTAESAGEDVIPGCRKVHVAAEYAISNLPWAKPLVTRETHALALERLQAAHTSGEAVRFGTLGNGLRVVSGSHCKFRSSGLVILAEMSGGQGVYSVYK